jgi:hypothetical protein
MEIVKLIVEDFLHDNTVGIVAMKDNCTLEKRIFKILTDM